MWKRSGAARWGARLAVLTLLLGMTTLAAATARAADGPSLGGRPFTAPNDIVPMPESWREKPITHDTPQPVDLAVALDQQLYPALLPFIEDYADAHDLDIAVQNGTCGISSGVLADKTADIGGFCCPPAFTDRLPGLKFHTIGIGALALIVHPDNPVEAVTLEEARQLFGGRTRSWADLPVSGMTSMDGREVRAVARLHCKQRPGHWRLILDDQNLFGRDIQEVSAIKDMVFQVADTPAAVGYETLWHIERHRTEGAEVKLLDVDGQSPRDDGAVASGAYPLYRVFNITTWGEEPAANPEADKLVAYLISKAPELDPSFFIIPVQRLQEHDWQFFGNELIGPPR